LNGTRQLLVYAGDANKILILSENISTIKKSTEALTHVSRQSGLEVDIRGYVLPTKYGTKS